MNSLCQTGTRAHVKTPVPTMTLTSPEYVWHQDALLVQEKTLIQGKVQRQHGTTSVLQPYLPSDVCEGP